uniref:Ig-like domain-containing protein n=1 Tax=Athene cunicularia TaxID=194338 RepID=A0A663MAY6_ATHCN
VLFVKGLQPNILLIFVVLIFLCSLVGGMPTSVVALREGQSTTFECQVVGTPEIHVTWYLDGNEVTDQAKYGVSFIDGLATLKVTQARVSDSGIYVCEAHNDAGSESCSVELKVKGWFLTSCHHPAMPHSWGDGVGETSSLKATKGTEVNLECEISGTPPFDVIWYKDRRQIRSSKKYKVTAKNYHTSVRILNVEAADVGEYQCKAQNDVGSDTCFCTVKLKGKVLAHMLSAVLPMALHFKNLVPLSSKQSKQRIFRSPTSSTQVPYFQLSRDRGERNYRPVVMGST